MTLKINPIVATLLIASILIMLFTIFKGCNQSRLDVAEREKAMRLADSALKAIKNDSLSADSTKKDFEIKNEFLEGQIVLVNNQKQRTEIELDKVLQANKELIAQHNLAQYTDTTAVTVPEGYIKDCADCFTKLDNTTRVTLQYKNDINRLQDSLCKQNELYIQRFKQLDNERIGFYNKINSIAQQQKEAEDKLKPHGRLYLSWGVLWHGWPSYAGAGLLYQTKWNMIYGAKCYYGANGMLIETTMNFPLSIKF